MGKTVLLEQLTSGKDKERILWLNGDTQETRDELGTTSEVRLKSLVHNADMVIIDEAQRIPNVGLSLKILIDTFSEKTYYVTGSSSLALSYGLQETLTGRTIIYRLFPFSTGELTRDLPDYQKKSLLNEQLRFGGYPYLSHLSTESEKTGYLKSIVSDYLFKDMLLLQDVEKPDMIRKLATLLAFKVGSQVSYNELSVRLAIDVKTVIRYISLLMQSFVIFEIGSYSGNLRSELTKSKKYYFWNVGMRNALIDQFMTLDLRSDRGHIWENFLAVERMKRHEYAREQKQYYFWRTYEQAEVDWLEVSGEHIDAFEFKWQGKAHTPKAFQDTYHESVQTVSTDNYLKFI